MALLVPLMAAAVEARPGATDWPRWRGPAQDGAVGGGDVIVRLETPELRPLWERSLGSGYSSVSVADGRAVTLYSDGEVDWLAAFDAEDGEPLWRLRIAETYPGHDGSHTGPISTPALADGRVFALGPWGHLVAVAAADGGELWRQDLRSSVDAPKPFYGFASSPLVWDGVVVLEVATEAGAAVVGFDAATGEVRWTAGSDTINYQSPVVFTTGGRTMIVAIGGESLIGLDPADGRELWRWEHGGDRAAMGAATAVPVPAGDGRLLLTVRQDESRMVRVRPPADEGGEWTVEELWSDRAFRGTYSVPVYHEGHLYGYTSRFLSCVDAETGEIAWRSRPPGDGFVILVDGHLVITTKKGTLHVAEASPEEYREVAGLELFDEVAWTPASFADGRIYARSMERLAAVVVEEADQERSTEVLAGAPDLGDGAFARFLERLTAAPEAERAKRVEEYWRGIEELPLIEAPDRVHFLYRGDAEDVTLGGDLVGARRDQPMIRVPGTDLHYWSYRAEPDARLSYFFLKDFEDQITDPMNPRNAESLVGPISWFGMPEWREPAHLREPATPAGRLETLEIPVEGSEEARTVEVWLPPGTDDPGDRRYPVVYVHDGESARDSGRMTHTLENIVGSSVEPVVVVFVHLLNGMETRDPRGYLEHFHAAVMPRVEERFPIRREPGARVSMGAGFTGLMAWLAALGEPHRFGGVVTQSMFMLDAQQEMFEQAVSEAGDVPLRVYLDWGLYDFRSPMEGWDMVEVHRNLVEYLRERGFEPQAHEAHDGFGWVSWRNRTDRWLEAMFPLAAAE